MVTSMPVYREREIEQLIQAVSAACCASIVGLSNMGKSTLLRALRAPEVADRYFQETGRRAACAYIDCNAMLELSGQGLYELVLRAVQESLQPLDPTLAQEIARHYTKVVDPDSQIMVPLSFNNALTACIQDGQRDLILLLDEFDEAFDTLDGRVFLNLRALRDRYPRSLIYVTATVRRLGSKRSDEQTAEFVELSASYTYTIGPMARPEADALAQSLVEQAAPGIELSPDQLDFLWGVAGGHPGLIMSVVGRLLETAALSSPLEEALYEALSRDMTVRSECARLWSQLSPDEREGLLTVAVGTVDSRPGGVVQSLHDWGLVRLAGSAPEVFCSLLADFVRRQATVQRDLPGGVWVDQDAGDVWVSGVPVETLSELEFRLLALLHERANKLTDKYQIVERVWGVEYLDEVDDARIEKLVSRLRSKIEPDPASPRYIQTVRGRGYRLNNTHSA